jgi:hypothetical protein
MLNLRKGPSNRAALTHALCLLVWFLALFLSPTSSHLPDTGGHQPVVHLPGDHVLGLAGPQGLVRFPDRAGSWLNGQETALVGVYAPGAFVLPVVPQPPGDNLFVSNKPEVVTQFHLPARTETTGLLAHNFLAGAYFYRLQVGDPVYLVFGDGGSAAYQVSEIADYRRLTAYQYRDLETGFSDSDVTLYKKIYLAGGDRLVLQTCIERDGNRSWGLRFFIATRIVKSQPSSSLRSPPGRPN